MKILIAMDGYFPGQKFGGPPVSTDNFCSLMCEHECYIVTKNHDLDEKTPYPGIVPGIVAATRVKNCRLTFVVDGLNLFEECRYGFECDAHINVIAI